VTERRQAGARKASGAPNQSEAVIRIEFVQPLLAFSAAGRALYGKILPALLLRRVGPPAEMRACRDCTHQNKEKEYLDRHIEPSWGAGVARFMNSTEQKSFQARLCRQRDNPFT
jgi:hypothetical protein